MQDWLNSNVPVGVRDAVRATIDASLDVAQADQAFNYPTFKPLLGKHRPIIEMRFKEGGLQYRPLLCEGPAGREATLLVGATKKGTKWSPFNARETAVARRKEIFIDSARTCPHQR
jgi:hypothetical protein